MRSVTDRSDSALCAAHDAGGKRPAVAFRLVGEHAAEQGLVFEVAFEGLQRSTRHKSGLAMRFPRINRLRWDKPPSEADRLETLERMLERIELGRGTATSRAM